MGVASLVLGIVGLVISFIPCLGMYGLFLTVPGVVLGFVGLIMAAKKNAPKGLAIAGVVCSIIGTIIAGWQYKKLSEASDSLTQMANELSAEFKKAAENAPKAEKDASLDKALNDAKKAVDKAVEDGKKAADEAAKKVKELAK